MREDSNAETITARRGSAVIRLERRRRRRRVLQRMLNPKLEKDLEQGVRSSEGALALFELRIKALIGFDPNNFFY